MRIQHWKSLTWKRVHPFIPHWSCYCVPVLWVVVVVVQSAICWHLWVDIHPFTNRMWSCQPYCQWRHPCPLHIALNLHPSSMDTLVDIHGRSHSFLFIHPRKVFLAWCWVIARPLSSCDVVLSLPPGVGLTWVGLVHLACAWQTPMHKGMPASDAMRRSWLRCRMLQCLCWSFTSYEGTIWCTTSWDLSSHLSLISLFH